MFRQVSCSVPIAQTILLGEVPGAFFQTATPQRRTACATNRPAAAAHSVRHKPTPRSGAQRAPQTAMHTGD